MTTYYLLGNKIEEGSNVIIGDFTYPYSWLENTTPELRASLGIEKVEDIQFDPRFYWTANQPKKLEDEEAVDENGEPVYVKVWDPTANDGIGAMVDTTKRVINFGLKTTFLNEVRYTTNQLLSSTDHYIIRNNTEGEEIPQSVSSYRNSVIEESTRLQNDIESATSLQELVDTINSTAWPIVE